MELREFPLYIIKFCEKEEYIDSLLAGNLYMKASGYFRSLPGEDTYRGDEFDGKKPLDIGDAVAYLEGPDGERIYMNGMDGVSITKFVSGFEGDDRVPIFCACLMSEDILEKTSEDSFKIKDEYIGELSQFGSYAAMIPLGELFNKLEQYRKENPHIYFKGQQVQYVDIRKYYDPYEVDADGEWDVPFFTKDNAYRFQHEWRLLAISGQELIGEGEDSWICSLGAFQYAVKLSTEDLIHGEFYIGGRNTRGQVL